MTENALLKSKEKALKKLRTACMAGELGVWYEVRGLVRQAQRKCIAEAYTAPQKDWTKEQQQQ